MALYTLAPQPWLVFLSGQFIVPAGQLAIYGAGTSTPATVYTAAGPPSIAHPWPITLDDRGMVPGGLYLQPGLSYKFVLHAPMVDQDLDGAVIKTQDNVAAVPSGGGGVLALSTPGFYSALDVRGLTLLEYDGAGDVYVSGLSGGATGQMLVIRNLTPYTMYLYSRDGTALAANQMYNFVSGVSLIVGPRGTANYIYTSSSAWGLAGYSQGGHYVQPFDAANYQTITGGGTQWVVEPTDQLQETWYLEGRHLFYTFWITNTSVIGSTYGLARQVPLGWVSSINAYVGTMLYTEDGGTSFKEGVVLKHGNTHVAFRRAENAPWTPTTNLTSLLGQIAIPLD